MLIIFLFLFIQTAYAQDYDKVLEEIQVNQQIAVEELNSDPDGQALERLRAKADKIKELREQKQEILQSKDYADYQQAKLDKVIADAVAQAEADKLQEIADAEALKNIPVHVAGINWTDLDSEISNVGINWIDVNGLTP